MLSFSLALRVDAWLRHKQREPRTQQKGGDTTKGLWRIIGGKSYV
jgi:hypothetical protein